MTIWSPDIEGVGPKAALIANAIADDISAGRLKPGERLPPQRDLAYRLGVSVGTVTRAYTDAERRGLVSATVGRGTYVRDRSRRDDGAGLTTEPVDDGIVDLSANLSRCALRQSVLNHAIDDLGRTPGTAELLEYQPAAGMARHRAAGADWIRRAGVDADPDRIVVCQGAQQALAVAFAGLTRPGDTVLSEALTFPPVKLHAEMFRFRLHGVALDGEGLVPDALEAAARATGARLLYTIPTFQNPTGAIMSEQRRRDIARIAEKYDLSIIEDDVYGAIAEPCPPPVERFAAERTWYVTSVSKCVAPGLRVGFLHCPTEQVDPYVSKVRAFGWVNAPLCGEIVARWIADGTADRMIAWTRRERAERAAIAREALGADAGPCNDAPHLWLALPEQWTDTAFAAETLRRGVRTAEGAAFAVGPDAGRDAIRVSLNAARTQEELRSALGVIADCLQSQPVRSAIL